MLRERSRTFPPYSFWAHFIVGELVHDRKVVELVKSYPLSCALEHETGAVMDTRETASKEVVL